MATPVDGVPSGLDPVYYAQYKLRRKQYDECIAICTEMLTRNPYDQAVWYLKTRALTQKSYIDDLDMEEEGIADILLDENEVSKVPRPGTSLKTPLVSRGGEGSLNPVSYSWLILCPNYGCKRCLSVAFFGYFMPFLVLWPRLLPFFAFQFDY